MVLAGGETNDYYLTARNDFFARPRMRALLEDFRPFPQYLRDDGSVEGIYFWFGPRGTVTPLVDCGRPDLERFPRYRDATILEAELRAGEVLFLPVGWWHYLTALDISINVTFNRFLFPNEFHWTHPRARPC